MKRTFIVGCPRSGTTLLQSMLAGSPELLSLPETHILRLGIGRGGAQLLGVARRRALLDSLRQELGSPSADGKARMYLLSRPELIQGMISLLDEAALERGYSGWVEKTPEHIFYAPQIENQFPDTRFVHVVRDGRAVVASIVEMWEAFTGSWSRLRLFTKQLNDYSQVFRALGSSSSDIRKKVSLAELWRMKSLARACILWNDCMFVTRHCHAKSNHLVIDYPAMTSDPAGELDRVCNFLEVDFDPEMLQTEKNILDLVNPHEPWKRGNADRIRPASTEKYDSLPPMEKELICELLAGSGDPNSFLNRDSVMSARKT